MATRDISDLTEPLYIGSNTNRTKFEVDGSIVNEGDSTTWEDIQTSLIGRRLYSAAGSIDYDYDENAIEFSQNGDINSINDVVGWSIQYPHKAKVDSEFRVHIHWEQTSTNDIEWSLKYRVQDNGSVKTTTWTTVVVSSLANNVFTYTSGTLNQITPLVEIDMTGYSISSILQFQLTRSDSTGGTVLGTFVDAHYEADTLGSRSEFIK